MRLLIYTGKTVRIDGDFAHYSRGEEREGLGKVHVIYFADTDTYRDFREIGGIHDSTYEAYNVEPLGDYYHDARQKDTRRSFFSQKRYQRRY